MNWELLMNRHMSLLQDKQRLQEILSQDEFMSHQADGENLLQKGIRYLIEWLAKLFKWTEVPAGASNAISTGILILAGLGLIFVIYWMTKRIVWEQKRKRSLFVHGEKIRAYTDYLRDAKEQGQAGNWREGERSLFLALLVYLQTREWIRIEKWKTNWEYADELQMNQPLAEELFRRHARTFDQVWYGQTVIDEELFWERLKELEVFCREEGQHG
ncbi:DUF4129 domain-containing protein [Brevibacillus reuszeri]|uniref:DUF4129 domain-containing protein n=1 Tax=Brevibacillus reuszeri TaxID=54915 RepID=UPI00289DE9CF|nr:DUF4129 domain-containing protein [Brevibacillus reuszeri]